MENRAEAVALTAGCSYKERDRCGNLPTKDLVKHGLRSSTSNRPSESCRMPPGHRRGGNSWRPLAGQSALREQASVSG